MPQFEDFLKAMSKNIDPSKLDPLTSLENTEEDTEAFPEESSEGAFTGFETAPQERSLEESFEKGFEDVDIASNLVAMGRQNLDIEEYNKYFPEGAVFVSDMKALNRARGANQAGSEQFVNMIMQLGIGEIVGGTMESIGYFANANEAFNVLNGQEVSLESFNEGLSHSGKQIKEDIRDAFPIYQRKEGGYNPSDSGWWASHLVSTGSTLSLMIPSMGIMKGIGLLGKGFRMLTKAGKLKRLAKAVKAGEKTLAEADAIAKMINMGQATGRGAVLAATGNVIGQATFSRHAESMMEASQLADSEYKRFMGMGTFTEEEAKKLAAEAATDVYKKNWALLAQDIIQYGVLAATGGKSIFGKSLLAKPGAVISTMASEGIIEEGYQHIISEEAKHANNVRSGLLKEEEGFKERFEEYLASGDFWTAVTFGAIGAGVFQGAGMIGSKLKEHVKNKQGYLKDVEGLTEAHLQAEEAPTGPTGPTSPGSTNDTATDAEIVEDDTQKKIFDYSARTAKLVKSIEAAKAQGVDIENLEHLVQMVGINLSLGHVENIGQVKDDLTVAIKELEEGLEEATKNDDVETMQELTSTLAGISRVSETVNAFEEVYAIESQLRGPEIAKHTTPLILENTLLEEVANNYNTQVEDAKRSIPRYKDLSGSGVTYLDEKMRLEALKTYVEKFLPKFTSDTRISEDRREHYKSELEEVNKEIAELEEKLGSKGELTEALSKQDKKILKGYKQANDKVNLKYASKFLKEAIIDKNIDDLNKWTENVEKTTEEAEKNVKENKENAEKAVTEVKNETKDTVEESDAVDETAGFPKKGPSIFEGTGMEASSEEETEEETEEVVEEEVTEGQKEELETEVEEVEVEETTTQAKEDLEQERDEKLNELETKKESIEGQIQDLEELKNDNQDQTEETGETALPAYTKTDSKGRTFTYFETTEEKDGLEVIKFTFNRSDKASDQRNPAGLPINDVLEEKGLKISDEWVPEGATATMIFGIKIDKETGVISASVQLKVDDGGQLYRSEVVLEKIEDKTEETEDGEVGKALEAIGVEKYGFNGNVNPFYVGALNKDLEDAISHATTRVENNPNVKVRSLSADNENRLRAELHLRGLNTDPMQSLSDVLAALEGKTEDTAPATEATETGEVEIIRSGLAEGFNANSYTSFDVRGDMNIMEKIRSQVSFAATTTRKGKKYVVVGLNLGGKSAMRDAGGRANYSFAVAEVTNDTPSNIVEILEKDALENYKENTGNTSAIIEDVKPLTDVNVSYAQDGTVEGVLEEQPKITAKAVETAVENEIENLSEEEVQAVEEEKHEKESVKDFLMNAVKGVQIVKSETIKKIVDRILKHIKKSVIVLIMASTVLGGKHAASMPTINQAISDNISEDIANIVSMPISDIVDLAPVVFDKITGTGTYASVESSLDMELNDVQATLTDVLENDLNDLNDLATDTVIGPEVESTLTDTIKTSEPFIKNGIVIGNSIFKFGNLERRAYVADMAHGKIKVELGFNTRSSKLAKKNKDVANSRGILGATHAHFAPSSKVDYKNYPVVITWNAKTKVITTKKSEDVISSDWVMPTSAATFTAVSDLDIVRSGAGFIITTGRDNTNGTAIIGKKDGGSFHIGIGSGNVKVGSKIDSKTVKDYRSLRGGMMIISSEDAQVSVIVSGSPNDIFKTLASLQDKYKDKKFYMFRGDTGTYSSSGFTSNGKTTKEDLRKYSSQNTWGTTQYLILLEDQETEVVEEEVKDLKTSGKAPIDPISASVFSLIAGLRRKRKNGGKLSKEDIVDIDAAIESLEAALEGINKEISQVKEHYKGLIEALEEIPNVEPVEEPTLTDQQKAGDDIRSKYPGIVEIISVYVGGKLPFGIDDEGMFVAETLKANNVTAEDIFNIRNTITGKIGAWFERGFKALTGKTYKEYSEEVLGEPLFEEPSQPANVTEYVQDAPTEEEKKNVLQELYWNVVTTSGNLENVDTPLNIDEVIDDKGKIEKDLSVAFFAGVEENSLKKDKANTIAWKSSGNIWSTGIDKAKNKELSLYLENPERSLKDHSFKIEVDMDYMKNNPKVNKRDGNIQATVDNSALAEQLTEGKQVINVGYMPVKATLLENGKEVQDSEGNPFVVYLHDHKYQYWAEKTRDSLVTATLAMKQAIADEYQKGNTVLFAEIKEKHPGKLNTDSTIEGKFILHNLQSTLNKPVKDMEFLMGGMSKEYLQSDGNLDQDIVSISATPGAVYVKVKTANGGVFPLRLFAENINEQEAEVIRLAYMDMLNDATVFQKPLSNELKTFIKKNEDSRVSEIANVKKLNTMTYKDLLNFLVFEGTRTAGKKGSALYVNKYGVLRAGNESFTRETLESKSYSFKSIVMQRKRRILGPELNNNAYKSYIVNNDLVRSNAISPYNDDILFVQPVIEIGEIKPPKEGDISSDPRERLRKFNASLNEKLKEILARLYPEIKLAYTNDPIQYMEGVYNQRRFKNEQNKANDIFWNEIHNKKLSANDILLLNNKLVKLSTRIGDVDWNVRLSAKGNYYIAGYKNAPVTMDDYYTPYARDIYYQMAEDAVNFRLRVVDTLIKMTLPKETKRTRKYGETTMPDRLTIRMSKAKNIAKELSKRGVPREQIEFVFAYMKRNKIEEISTADLALAIMKEYSNGVSVETSTKEVEGTEAVEYEEPTGEFHSESTGRKYYYTDELGWLSSKLEGDEEQVYEDYDAEDRGEKFSLPEDAVEQMYTVTRHEERTKEVPTSTFDFVKVEGGVNYRENVIRTPFLKNIISSGEFEDYLGGYHDSDFNKGRGDMLGWFRSMEKEDDTSILALLEIQSGFQKIKDKENIVATFVPGNKIGVTLGSEEQLEALYNKNKNLYYLVDELAKDNTYTVVDYKKEIEKVEPQYLPDENQYEPGYDIESNKAVIKDEKGNEYSLDFGQLEAYGITVENLSAEEMSNKNDFLQLLNKNNNWVKFFVQSIMQDAAKKGYKKVQFPTGETAAKVEKHTPFKDRIASLDAEIEEYRNLSKEKLQEKLAQLEIESEVNAQDVAELESRMDSFLNNTEFKYQEPVVSVEGYRNSRVQHTESPARQRNNDVYLELLPKDYKGYYIYSYNVGGESIGTPITDAEALEHYNAQSGISRVRMEDRQEFIHLRERADKLSNKFEIDNVKDRIKNFEQEKERNAHNLKMALRSKSELLKDGIEKVAPIENFYETRIYNTFKKLYGAKNLKRITDKKGHTWVEVSTNEERELGEILLQQTGGTILGQYDQKALKILIDAVNQRQDTLPHEYAHHYIRMFRDHPIVQEAINKFGTEEKLVQFIGEQAVKQEGKAWQWWKKFVNWILNNVNANLEKLEKEQLGKILTDAFLTRQDLSEAVTAKQSKDSVAKAFKELGFEGSSMSFSEYENVVTVKSTSSKENVDAVAKGYVDAINLDLFADKITLTDENFNLMKPEDC